MNTILNNRSKRTYSLVLWLIPIAVISLLFMTGCASSKQKDSDDHQKAHTASDITISIEKTEDTTYNTPNNTVDNTEDNVGDNTVASYHPDDYYIKWAVPRQYISIKDDTIDLINRKLENDGFDFGLKLILLDDMKGEKSYFDEMLDCGADIAFTWFDTDIDSDGNIINNYEAALSQGKFECLDGYLEGSKLYSSKPELFWDRVRYNGSIYLFPSEIIQPGAEFSLYNDAFPMDGDICELIRCVYEDQKLLYGLTRFGFMNCYGFYYDELQGIVTDKDGNIINPFDEDFCIRWLKTLRSLYENDLLITNSSNPVQRDSCDIFFPDISDKGTGRYGFEWKMPLSRTYRCSTAILASSGKKEQAFKLVEILRTRPDYGNLLIYGITDVETEKPVNSAYTNKLVFGIDDGLLQVEDGLVHFNSFEERNAYYNEHVSVSPTVYMDFPPEYIELYRIVDRYLGVKDSIIEHDDFEEELEKFKTEYSEALEIVMEKMNK